MKIWSDMDITLNIHNYSATSPTEFVSLADHEKEIRKKVASVNEPLNKKDVEIKTLKEQRRMYASALYEQGAEIMLARDDREIQAEIKGA